MSRKIIVLNNAAKRVRLTPWPRSDANHNLTQITDSLGRTILLTYYYAAGNLTQLTYPGGRKVNYTYDALNRVKTVTIDWLADRPGATYSYDEAGRMTSLTTFNGITTSYGYDASNRITALTSPVASYSFTLDGSGNRISETRTEPFSPAINTATTTYGYNTRGNRLLSAGTASFGYDNEGQLASGYGSSYSFDSHHRLTGAGGSSYFYDGGNNRLQATRSGTTTRYIYDAGGNLLAEADASNAITRYYIHGNGLLAMVTPDGQVYNYHYNTTGSTIAVTDQSQGMVNTYAYDPFGTIVGQQETIPQPFKFVGQYGVMAEPNGFYYMKARYYDPNVGRFISEDPLGFDGGDVNLMAYVQNNPVNSIDPFGLCSEQSTPVADIAKGFVFGTMASGVVTLEVAQIVAQDSAKAVITTLIPSTPAGGFAIDKSFTLIELTKNVAGDLKAMAERVGQRIEALRKWWYGR